MIQYLEAIMTQNMNLCELGLKREGIGIKWYRPIEMNAGVLKHDPLCLEQFGLSQSSLFNHRYEFYVAKHGNISYRTVS